LDIFFPVHSAGTPDRNHPSDRFQTTALHATGDLPKRALKTWFWVEAATFRSTAK